MIRQVDFRQFVQPGILHDRATSAASPGASAARHLVRRSRELSISRGCDFSTVPGLTRWYYRMNPCKGNSPTCGSVLDAVENIEEMNQPTFHRRVLKGDLFNERKPAMRMKWGNGRGEYLGAWVERR
jgi:hypothetical protein